MHKLAMIALMLVRPSQPFRVTATIARVTSGADMATTLVAMQNRRVYERDPLLGSRPGTARVVLTNQALVMGLNSLTYTKFAQRHTRMTKTALAVFGEASVACTANNVRVIRRH